MSSRAIGWFTVALFASTLVGAVWLYLDSRRVSHPRALRLKPDSAAQAKTPEVATSSQTAGSMKAYSATSLQPPQVPERTRQEQATLLRDDMSTLETALRSDRRDSLRESEVGDRVRVVLKGPEFPNLSIDSLECSKTLCRLELKLAGSDGRIDDMPIVEKLAQMGPHGGIMITTSPEIVPEGSARVFLSTYGSVLPIIRKGPR